MSMLFCHAFAQVVAHYIRGLHWVLQYYYRGVASWDWFYPYHYAPMAQDMRTLGDIDGGGGEGAGGAGAGGGGHFVGRWERECEWISDCWVGICGE
jgi:hypothetical protein